jgi:cytochrome c-type biogenesis protein CcmH/NrfG
MPRTARFVGESIVRGLRLEPDLAEALKRYAETQAKAHGAPVNMASAARTLLREGLRLEHGEHNCKKEGYFAGIAEAREKMATALRG